MSAGTPEAHKQLHLPESVRLFPLPDHVLLPHTPTPYRIFEPRYRTLVEDLLLLDEEERWLAVPRLSPSHPAASAAGMQPDPPPAFEHVATIGRVVNVTPLSDGEYLIVVDGAARCQLTERPTTRPYREATVRPFDDLEDVIPLAPYLDQVIGAVSGLLPLLGSEGMALIQIAAERDQPERLLCRLASMVMPEPDQRQTFLEERHISTRADLVFEALVDLMAAASLSNDQDDEDEDDDDEL